MEAAKIPDKDAEAFKDHQSSIPAVSSPELEILDKEELDAIEDALSLAEQQVSSLKRKEKSSPEHPSPHFSQQLRKLPDWGSWESPSSSSLVGNRKRETGSSNWGSWEFPPLSSSSLVENRKIETGSSNWGSWESSSSLVENRKIETGSSNWGSWESSSSSSLVENRKIETGSSNWGSWEFPPLSSSSLVENRKIGTGSEKFDSHGEEEDMRIIRELAVNAAANLNLRRSTCQVMPKYSTMNFPGRIIYGQSFEDVENAAVELMGMINSVRKNDDPVPIGFDIEWRPSFTKGEECHKASVMQLCMDNNRCFVLHIFHTGIPPLLQSILQDQSILKVGVGIANDASKICGDYGVPVKGVMDLSSLANEKLGGSRKWGLSSLTEMLTCKQLLKPKRIRLGNWERDLSKAQLQYAATDAYASWYLYQVLKSIPDASGDVNRGAENAVHS